MLTIYKKTIQTAVFDAQHRDACSRTKMFRYPTKPRGQILSTTVEVAGNISLYLLLCDIKWLWPFIFIFLEGKYVEPNSISIDLIWSILAHSLRSNIVASQTAVQSSQNQSAQQLSKSGISKSFLTYICFFSFSFPPKFRVFRSPKGVSQQVLDNLASF